MTENKIFSKGFTLLELLVVVAIIGILSTVIIVSVNSARAKARDSRRISDIKQIEKAFLMYLNLNNGNFPSANGQANCLGFGDGVTCWTGDVSGFGSLNSALTPYLPNIPRDPLYGSRSHGNAYLYRTADVVYNCNAGQFRSGPFLLWKPDKDISGVDDKECKGLGFAACGGPTGGYYCAYKLQ